MSRRETVRKTLKWLVIIVFLATLTGGGYAYWLWTNQNALLLSRIREKLAEIAPDWDIELGSARFDWSRRVHIYNVTLRVKGQSAPILLLPEAVLTIDRRKLDDEQRLVIHKVRLLAPEFDLVRRPDGRWNWQDLPRLPEPEPKKSCPDWEIEQATVRLRLEQPAGRPPVSLKIKQAGLKLIPSGKRKFLLKGDGHVQQAGRLNVEGQWDLDAKTWTVNGRMHGVPFTDEDLDLVRTIWHGLPTEARRRKIPPPLTKGRLGGVESPQAAVPPPASPYEGGELASRGVAPGELARAQSRNGSRDIVSALADLDISGTLDVTFRVARWQTGSEPEVRLLVELRQGRITGPQLPFPLDDVAGRIYHDDRHTVLQTLVARNGVTRIDLDGEILHSETIGRGNGNRPPNRFAVQITNLPLDDRLRRCLPDAARRAFDSLRLSGPIDVKGNLVRNERGEWSPRSFILTARGCRATPEKFPYPVHGIVGTIEQDSRHADLFAVAVQGLLGRQTATARGFIRNPGPDAEVLLDVAVSGLPVDDTLRTALKPAARETLESLRLEGWLNADVRLHRPAGPDRRFQTTLVADVRDGSIKFDGFPYRLSNVTGRAIFSSETGGWTFEDFQASHGPAHIVADGTFSKSAHGADGLQLALRAYQVQLDVELRRALPKRLHDLWGEFSPAGQIDELWADITWAPGQPVNVALPKIDVSGGEMTARSFPYPIEAIEAAFSYEPARSPRESSLLSVYSFSGRHDETQITARGFVEFSPQGEWRARIVELSAGDLIPDRLFRRALPRDLRTVLEELNPQGTLSLAGMLEFRGTEQPQDPVTAAWDLNVLLDGNSLTTGIDLKDVRGSVTIRGTWDGEQAVMGAGNRIDLESVTVRGYRLSDARGPFRFNERGEAELIVGSRDSFVPRRRDVPFRPIPVEDHISAKVIGGVLTLDAAVGFEQERRETPYRLRITLRQGKLEQYAREYLSGAANLKGVMDGWVDLYGRGSSAAGLLGRGQLQISPAALYELPIFVQVFKVLTFVPPDKTAFTYALASFRIAGGLVQFGEIDLVGDAISLRGKGTVSFDGRIALEFYSMLPRNQLPIPIVKQLVSTATSGWVGVTVRGTADAPIAEVRPVPQLDNTLRRFLGAFGAGRAAFPRRMFPPPASPPRKQNGR